MAVIENEFMNFEPLPAEIQFDPITRVFTISKCVNDPADPDCLDPAYTIRYKVVIIATATTSSTTFEDTSQSFYVSLTEDCTTDTPDLQTFITTIDYYISELDPQPVFVPGQTVDNNPQCDLEFSLVEFGSDTYPSPPFKNFNSQTGDFVILSDDFLLDNVRLDISTFITSIYSSSSLKTRTDNFSVFFYSECREITQWSPSQFDIENESVTLALGETKTFGVSAATSPNQVCSSKSIVYEIAELSGGSANLITMNAQVVAITPTTISDVGVHTYKIKACVQNANGECMVEILSDQLTMTITETRRMLASDPAPINLHSFVSTAPSLI